MRRRDQAGGMARLFYRLLVVLVVVGLASAVVYLLSDLNRRRYRLAVHDQTLVVERGRFLPYGFEPIVPDSQSAQKAYAPVRVPDGASVTDTTEVFEDRAELDRTLFSLLAGWARGRLDDPDPASFALAREYVDRCEALPSLAEEQRQEVRRLRGSMSYTSGMRLLGRIEGLLKQAREHFLEAVELNAPSRNDALRQIQAIERRLLALPSNRTPSSGEPLPEALAQDGEATGETNLEGGGVPPGGLGPSAEPGDALKPNDDRELDIREPSDQQTGPPGRPPPDRPHKWRL